MKKDIICSPESKAPKSEKNQGLVNEKFLKIKIIELRTFFFSLPIPWTCQPYPVMVVRRFMYFSIH